MAPLRRWLTVIVLGLLAVYEVGGALRWSAVPRGDGMALCFALFTAAVLVAGLGVAARRFWGRALALGVGVAGILDGVSVVARGLDPVKAALFGAMPLAILILLSGRRMRDHFSARSALWRSGDWRLSVLSLAIVAAVPTIAGLVRYAATSPWWIGADDRAVALGASLALAGGALSALSGRTAGLVVMFAGACASAGLAFESLFRLNNPLSGSYTCMDGMVLEMAMASVVPGVVAVFGAMAVFAPAMWRFLRAS